MVPRRIVILGATGSIGRNALEVCRALPSRLSVLGLAAAQSWSVLAEQAQAHDCRLVAVADSRHEPALKRRLGGDCQVLAGEAGMIELCTRPEVDMVLCAIAGTGGLRPVLAAIEAGKDIALASKELLVMAGGLVMGAAARRGVRIIPVDSEHSAIFQCLRGESRGAMRRIVLTASGGPFRDYSRERLRKVGYREALAHPTWQMGAKITIDSATLMNKGLELIEAHWLFGLDQAAIEVVVHPQSIVHSMVEMCDGSLLAQMGCPDMRLPIQYALTFPERANTVFSSIDLPTLGRLDFLPVRETLFPAVRLARQAVEGAGTLPAVFNAANEAAVEAFRDGRIGFLDIPRLVEQAMAAHRPQAEPDLTAIMKADAWARSCADELSA